MNPKRIIKFLVLALFLFFQVYLLFIKEIEVLDYPHYLNEKPLPLFKDTKKASQQFRSPGTITRIDIMLANYLLKPESGIIRLTIFEDNKENKPHKKGKRIYLKNHPANTAEDNRFYSFPLHEHNIPKGNYKLQLNYFRENKDEKIAVWISEKDRYPYGQLSVNGEKQDGDMTFRVYYSSTIWKEKHRWINKIPGFPLKPYFLLAGLLALLVSLNTLLYKVLFK